MADNETYPTSLEVVGQYLTALAAGDSAAMDACRADDYVLDLVQGDAFDQEALTHDETRAFWPAWFAGFPEMDYLVTRTVAAETVVVSQWVFTGTNSGALASPIFGQDMQATGKTVRLRGVSVFDVEDGAIKRETLYIDLATLFVELGVTL
jgi:steroid delta-isomerase-like uncharacterized protein